MNSYGPTSHAEPCGRAVPAMSIFVMAVKIEGLTAVLIAAVALLTR